MARHDLGSYRSPRHRGDLRHRSPSVCQQLWHRDCSKGGMQKVPLPQDIVPTQSCLGSPAAMSPCAGQTLNKDGPCPKDPAI